MHTSLWENTAELPAFPSLQGDLKTDVLVIGGGICGLLCAYLLQKEGVNCTVVEADRICGGVTGKTTAKITSLHGLLYGDLVDKYGVEIARKYFAANQLALSEYAKLSEGGDWDFTRRTAFTYSLSDRAKIEREFSALQRLGASVQMQYHSPLPIPFAAAVGLREQAQFHPLKFLRHIAKDLKIYENTPIGEVATHEALYAHGKIRAKNIIVATHFPIFNKYGMYFIKQYQHRSYVLALENAQCLDGMYVDEDAMGLSFRSAGNLLLLGGGGGRTGKKCGNWAELKAFRDKYYPNSKIRYQWATQDCMTLDKIPLIGAYSPRTPNLYVATGFNKWGMTSSMVAAQVLRDTILGRQNEYAHIFAPDRSILHPQLFINGFETITSFLTPTPKRCPHLGCALKWNKYEHSWDCPCHGSRFTPDGTILNTPANKGRHEG